jgi:putative sporulation protein YtxC
VLILDMVCQKRSLWNKSWQEWASFIDMRLHPLEGQGYRYNVRQHGEERLTISCAEQPPNISEEEVRRIFQRMISAAVADFIVEVLEKKLISHLLHHEFIYREAKQKEDIYGYVWKMLWLKDDEDEHGIFARDDEKIQVRKAEIFVKAYEYVHQDGAFHADGFLRFRLKDYYNELYAITEYAVDEYVLDQEYKEFIRLLQYYISIQAPKIPLLHVIHQGAHRFQLLDDKGGEIQAEDLPDQWREWSQGAGNHGELIISTLMTIAPQKIVLHTAEPSLKVIQTLCQIFEERLTVCKGCMTCKKWGKTLPVRN